MWDALLAIGLPGAYVRMLQYFYEKNTHTINILQILISIKQWISAYLVQVYTMDILITL